MIQMMDEDYFLLIQSLRDDVKIKFGHSVDSMKDFQKLSESTKLSVQTLRRFYGKIDTDKRIGTTSLNLLAEYVGFQDWYSYCKSKLEKPIDPTMENLIYNFYDSVIFSQVSLWDKAYFDLNYAYCKILVDHPSFAKNFIKKYINHKEIIQNSYALFPSEDRWTMPEYRKLIEYYTSVDNTPHYQVSMNGYLAFGSFLSGNIDEFHYFTALSEAALPAMRKEYPYFFWPEARYYVAQIIKAALMDDSNKMEELISEFLWKNEEARQSQPQRGKDDDVAYIYLCEAFVWLGKLDMSWLIYRKFLERQRDLYSRFYGTSRNYFLPLKEDEEIPVFAFLEALYNGRDLEINCNPELWSSYQYRCVFKLLKDFALALQYSEKATNTVLIQLKKQVPRYERLREVIEAIMKFSNQTIVSQ